MVMYTSKPKKKTKLSKINTEVYCENVIKTLFSHLHVITSCDV